MSLEWLPSAALYFANLFKYDGRPASLDFQAVDRLGAFRLWPVGHHIELVRRTFSGRERRVGWPNRHPENTHSGYARPVHAARF